MFHQAEEADTIHQEVTEVLVVVIMTVTEDMAVLVVVVMAAIVVQAGTNGSYENHELPSNSHIIRMNQNNENG